MKHTGRGLSEPMLAQVTQNRIVRCWRTGTCDGRGMNTSLMKKGLTL